MDDLDPHLKILLNDFARLCPEDAPLEQDDWTGLYEISLFVHEQAIRCPASSIGEYLIQQGCSPSKAIFVGHQYGHFLHILKLRDQRTPLSAEPRGEDGNGGRKEVL
jgi:hypothetical protein